jgi:hypothetical protein
MATVAGGSTHFILMLDSSETMSRQQPRTNWEILTSEVREFMRILREGSNASNRVTIISYDDTSVVNFKYQMPTESLLNQVPYMGHGTQFDPPLLDAYDVAKEFEN